MSVEVLLRLMLKDKYKRNRKILNLQLDKIDDVLDGGKSRTVLGLYTNSSLGLGLILGLHIKMHDQC